MLSVIIPAYNEEAMIEKTASVIGGILADAGTSSRTPAGAIYK